MANLLHFNQFALAYKHRNNILDSLSHRAEIAKANNNTQLLELLEQERRQLVVEKTQVAGSSLVEKLGRLRRSLMQAIAPDAGLQVRQVMDEAGGNWWYAYDPQTGEAVYAETETELNQWLKIHYQGK
ncbi:hypothetical protein BST81_06345 [Leptolyngbya sp. 'hensonii']|uniref:hypothetical protein n=1 Tax=Leptolyngbya sp. 'hensonii' TaxID=1922337 RepID=UPI00094FAAA6|nr:hypothetical protein [Leptolyngbya sp. 'hensonii']OLP19365.1 hypothetical protein BST81_06345 [Leptolyngbya sp. 'hensonii']